MKYVYLFMTIFFANVLSLYVFTQIYEDEMEKDEYSPQQGIFSSEELRSSGNIFHTTKEKKSNKTEDKK